MADNTQDPVMPPEIASAVIEVMTSLGTLEKGQENKFDKYDYASIDDFIKFVRENCVTAGLFIIPQEDGVPELKEMKKKDGSPLMMWWGRFGFILAHESGAHYGPIYKTVMVQATGAQAAGSAQSYALKQLLRGLFLIPTGDKDDPDTKGTAEISAAGQQKSDLQKESERIHKALSKAVNLETLEETWTLNELRIDEIKEKSLKAHTALSELFDKKKAGFEIDSEPSPLG